MIHDLTNDLGGECDIRHQIITSVIGFNEIFMGCLGYCDDNINISSIVFELQLMINNYVEYCFDWGIKINDEKCFLVPFGFYNDINAKF